MNLRPARLQRVGKLTVVLLFAVTCCSESPTKSSLERRTLEDNRELFRQSVGTSYGYDFQNVCFCGPDTRAPVRIEVRDGQFQSVVLREDGTAVARERWDQYLTVEQVFASIEDALDESAASVRVAYDPSLGYPRDVFIDFNEMIADEELGFTVENLSAVR